MGKYSAVIKSLKAVQLVLKEMLPGKYYSYKELSHICNPSYPTIQNLMQQLLLQELVVEGTNKKDTEKKFILTNKGAEAREGILKLNFSLDSVIKAVKNRGYRV